LPGRIWNRVGSVKCEAHIFWCGKKLCVYQRLDRVCAEPVVLPRVVIPSTENCHSRHQARRRGRGRGYASYLSKVLSVGVIRGGRFSTSGLWGLVSFAYNSARISLNSEESAIPVPHGARTVCGAMQLLNSSPKQPNCIQGAPTESRSNRVTAASICFQTHTPRGLPPTTAANGDTSSVHHSAAAASRLRRNLPKDLDPPRPPSLHSICYNVCTYIAIRLAHRCKLAPVSGRGLFASSHPGASKIF